MRFMTFVVDGHFYIYNLYFTFLFDIYILYLYLFIVLYFSGFNQVVILLNYLTSLSENFACLWRQGVKNSSLWLMVASSGLNMMVNFSMRQSHTVPAQKTNISKKIIAGKSLTFPL